MVRVLSSLLSVLLLASFASADYQTCGDSKYTTFASELQDGETIDGFCSCLRKNLEADKIIPAGLPYNCGENSDVVAKLELKATPLPVPQCPDCNNGTTTCENLVGDPDRICAVVKATESPTNPIVVKPVTAAALRIRIIIIIIIRTRRVDVYIGIQW
ncbi:uncharacterized protein LOC119085204 [Bradysia coprophila]|uniref:uncharacterized protein LOC119085204 n=1 Tax=Bradysia coprophila TaxID=38358 RepID=UPI00187DC3D2|nr:uncharacterized protein LOC119085204 [Bradysia coprophila]